MTALAAREQAGQVLGAALVRLAGVPQSAVDAAVAAQQAGAGGRIGDILVGLGVVSRAVVEDVLQMHTGRLVIDIDRYPQDTAVATRLPAAAAQLYQCLPVDMVGKTLIVATAGIAENDRVAAIRFACGTAVQVLPADNPARLVQLIERTYARISQTKVCSKQLDEANYEAMSAAVDTPAGLFRRVLAQALNWGASDIHIRPMLDGSKKVFVRVDGHLREVQHIEHRHAAGLVRHIEIFSRIDSFSRGAPKEGRFSVQHEGRPVDLRVSVIAGPQGDSVVLRVLDPARFPSSLDNLTMPPLMRNELRRSIARPSGLLITAGPTGSGKTTLLYTLLRELASRTQHVVTAEDPVEFQLEGVNQFETNNFSALLPQLLRHDPDVIMVGELRDDKTVAMALNAALTGHLVLSSLHATDCAASVHRLLGLGAPLHLVASCLLGVCSQRLARLTCRLCGGVGCSECGHSGYRGRTLVLEMAAPSSRLMSLQGFPSYQDVADSLVFVGNKRLDNALDDLARAGLTTQQEAAALKLRAA